MGKKRNTAYGTVSTPHQVNRDNIFKITRRILQDVSFYLCLLCIAILTDSDSDTWVIAKYKTLEGWSQVLTSCLISLMGGLPGRRTFPVCGIPPTLTRGPALFQKEVVEQRWPHPILPVSTGARSLPGLLGRPRKQAPVMSVVLTLADLLALIKADFTFHKGLPGWARDWMGSTFPSHSYPLLKNKQTTLIFEIKKIKKKDFEKIKFLPPGLLFCGCWVVQSCLTLCDPMDCSTPGFPVLHHLSEFAQTYVHWVDDAIQPSHPLSSPSPPALNLSQHQWIHSSHEITKLWELQLQHQLFPWISRVDFL